MTLADEQLKMIGDMKRNINRSSMLVNKRDAWLTLRHSRNDRVHGLRILFSGYFAPRTEGRDRACMQPLVPRDAFALYAHGSRLPFIIAASIVAPFPPRDPEARNAKWGVLSKAKFARRLKFVQRSGSLGLRRGLPSRSSSRGACATRFLTVSTADTPPPASLCRRFRPSRSSVTFLPPSLS